MPTKEDYDALCVEIWRHNKLYFVDHVPEITDQDYDLLLKDLEKMEKGHSEWLNPLSPSQRVGEMLTDGFKTVPHVIPMMSLANTYSRDEIRDFFGRVEKLLGNTDFTVSCELKMDGIAISVRYEKGLFCRAVTRGDGKKGDEITANVKTIVSLPLVLNGENIPDVLEVRGEIFMPIHTFMELNAQKKEEGLEPWANPRNAAAGSLKLLDPREVSRRGLSIVLYSIAEGASAYVDEQYASHQLMQNWGFPTVELRASCQLIDEVWSFVEEVLGKRSHLAYEIDGVVIKLNSLEGQKRLAYTGKHPRWAVAYKFAAEQTITRIKKITVQVGRTGVLTPVAELEPIFLAGSTISRATLHNEDEIRRKDIRVGDTVKIEKGGDVIPKVVEVILDHRLKDSQAWSMPELCPDCSSAVVRMGGEVAVRCGSFIGCPAQNLRRLIFFASKQAMNVDTLGEKVVEQLVDADLVSKFSDFYLLNEEQLLKLEGFKEKAVENLLASLEHSKLVNLSRFMMALGIPYVGIGAAELLAKKAGTLELVMALSRDELLSIDGIGEKIAESVIAYFSNKEYSEEIQRLLALGIKIEELEIRDFNNHPFNGKTFVLTGTLLHYARDSAAALIKERSGKVTSSISKKTDFLLAGEKAGSKLLRAEKLGVTVMSEEEFQEAL